MLASTLLSAGYRLKLCMFDDALFIHESATEKNQLMDNWIANNRDRFFLKQPNVAKLTFLDVRLLIMAPSARG